MSFDVVCYKVYFNALMILPVSYNKSNLIYPAVLVGLVSARDENLLMVLDLDDVLPAAGETVGTGGLVEDEDVEVTVN